MRISVAVITYNWPEALELVLLALARQTELPFEVIVTDDGSRDDTRQLVKRMAQDYPTRLVHLWQPDDGARMSRARNRAIAAARGDYIVLLDGDMVAARHFIEDHRAFARQGCFVQGSRVLADASLTSRLLSERRTTVGFFERGVERRRNSLRVPVLARVHARPVIKQRGIKSCNMGFWHNDLIRLNGFNEAMVGWGREDTELALRAFHAGLLRRDVRFSALATHLYHASRKHVVDNPNDRFVEETRVRKLARTERGVDQHFADFTAPVCDARQALQLLD